MKRFCLLLSLILILSGCAQSPTATLVPTLALPTRVPTKVVTLAIETSTTASGTPSAPAQGAATASPVIVATSTATAQSAYPAPGATREPKSVLPSRGKATATTQANASAASSSSPFHDCARTPGLMGCDPSAPSVSARLAFFDPTAGRVIALDLQSGSSWQAALRTKWLQWSPGGDKLLLSQGAEAGPRYALFGADGQPQSLPVDAEAMQEGLRWQPDDSLSGISTIRSADGATARLESTPDMRWLLRVQPKSGAEQTFDITPQPSDQLTILVDWIPGTKRLLAQRYQASNAAMLLGGELISIDTTDGSVQPLQITTPLFTGAGISADLAWNPVQKGLLAVIASGGEAQSARRLALLDLNTNQLRYPLPDGVVVSDLAWRPDGSALAFRAVPGPGVSLKDFPSAGIYQLNLPGDEVKVLVQSAEGATDGWPQWSPDGKALLYGRGLSTQGGAAGAQVRLRQLADGKEWVLVEGLPGPREIMGQVLWFEQLAYHPK